MCFNLDDLWLSCENCNNNKCALPEPLPLSALNKLSLKEQRTWWCLIRESQLSFNVFYNNVLAANNCN